MRIRLRLATAVALSLAACADSTEPAGPTVNLVGNWAYSGNQATPSLELLGTLVVSSQSGRDISGSLTWEERDGLGGVNLRSAQVTGRVIGLEDTDFDALAVDATRRHVARVSTNGDTIAGVWIATSISRNGSFKAVRTVN